MNTPLSPQERIRRVALLCTHCFRNFAFYRAGWKGIDQQARTQFLKTANSGFIDIGYLEWCKLFADLKGNHHWTKVIKDHQAFQSELLNFLRITPEELTSYIQAVRTYRDKFIAHLDDERVMHPPKTKIARNSAAFLYDYLRTHPEAGQSLQDAKLTAKEYYEHLYRHAFFAYKAAL